MTSRTPSTIAAALVLGLLAALGPLAAARPAEAAAGKPAAVLSPRLGALVARATTATSDAGEARIAEVPADGAGSLLRADDGDLRVNARLATVDASTEASLARAGAVVVARSVPDHLVTLEVPTPALDQVAAVAGVQWVEEVLEPEVHRTSGDELAAALEAGGVTTSASCASRVVSEADTQLGAATARTTYGVDGTGVRVGVLSDSYDALGGAAADVAAGELPGPANPCGRTTPVTVQAEGPGDGADEGRAMAQAVHDVAPGAAISFATAFVSDVDFANQIRNLATNGATVIVDDISYFNEPMYQDGIIAKAVADVTAAGVTYFSSAGNGNIVIGGREVASYEATAYRPVACPSAVTSGDCHDLDPGAGTDTGNGLTIGAGGKVVVKLGWSQPQFGITTDLDLFLIDTTTGLSVASAVVGNPSSSRQAYELLSYTNSTGSARTFDLVVNRYQPNGTPRFKTVIIDDNLLTGVQRNLSSGTDVVGPSSYGHNLSRAMASVAATKFSSSSAPETFSSRGPATYCWNPVVGTTAASALPACEVDQLDVTATDGAANSFFGQLQSSVWRFYGTSQAAPHAAAVAALQRQARPCRTPAEVLAAQRTSADAIGAYGQDAIGSGRVDAPGSIAALAPCVVAPTAPGAPTGVTGAAGNGQVSLSWTAPASDGGSAITGYTVTPFVGATAQAPRVFTSAATAQAITGLANGVAHTFTVAATNAVGTGAASSASAPVTPSAAATAPGAPTGVTGVGGHRQVTVSWIAPASDGGSAITGYTVTPSVGATALTPTVFASAATSQVVGGLLDYTGYTFTVAATNAVGTGTASVPSAVTSTTAPWAPFTSWGALVDRLHVDLLGRPPTASERSGWIAQLQAETTTPGGVVAALRVSSDHLANVDTVARLYRAYFLRDADPSGFAHWLGQRRSGKLLAQISSRFADSSEFRSRYGTLTNRAFVQLVYLNVLDRPGDADGIAYWAGRLDKGKKSRGQVMLEFSESTEYRRTIAAEVEVAVQYLLLLGRLPTPSESAALVAALEAETSTPAEVADAIVASAAYAARVAGQ